VRARERKKERENKGQLSTCIERSWEQRQRQRARFYRERLRARDSREREKEGESLERESKSETSTFIERSR